MTVRAIDPLGVTVDYPTANRWTINAAGDTIHLYDHKEIVAVLPGHYIVSVLPFSQTDPGVEARD